MCQAENKSKGIDVLTRTVVCNMATCFVCVCVCVCVCLRARAQNQACKGTAQELEWVAEEISWLHQVLLGLQRLTLIILGLNKKLLSLPLNQRFLARQEGRVEGF